jgi:hypothetical protein
MSDYIDRLLAKARLVPTDPYTQADIEAGERRVAARVAARLAGIAPPPASPRTPTIPPGCQHLVDPVARSLRVLCEAVLTRPGAFDHLGSFHDSSLPEPEGARVLGCILYLADCEDSARFWWQYAAGASDHISSYSLYLYHRSVGEEQEAEWWYDHTAISPATLDKEATRLEIATALHVLCALRGSRSLPAHVRVLIDFVPAVVGFVDDDLDLPLVDGDLASLVEDINDDAAPPAPPTPRGRLPERRGKCSITRTSAGRGDARWGMEVKDALEECEQAVTC